jgi:sulfatase maturation enzyme AslB (radical SAM superfamily)
MMRLIRACPWATYDTAIAVLIWSSFRARAASKGFRSRCRRDLLATKPFRVTSLFQLPANVKTDGDRDHVQRYDYGPQRLSVELANICNLHCSYCFRADENLYSFHAEFFPLELLRRVISEARDGSERHADQLHRR